MASTRERSPVPLRRGPAPPGPLHCVTPRQPMGGRGLSDMTCYIVATPSVVEYTLKRTNNYMDR